MAEREGLPKGNPSNVLDFLTFQNRTVEAKRKSPGLSNRIEPPPEREIAAPAETGNGDKSGKLASNSEAEIYSIASPAARFPILAEHVGIDDEAYKLSLRQEAEEIIEASLDLVERMLRILDVLDPDPDMEPGGDDEPSLGWPMGHGTAQLRKGMAHDDDREQDDADLEDGGDYEPGEDDEPDHESVPDYPDDPRKPQYVQSIQDGSYLTEMRNEREVIK